MRSEERGAINRIGGIRSGVQLGCIYNICDAIRSGKVAIGVCDRELYLNNAMQSEEGLAINHIAVIGKGLRWANRKKGCDGAIRLGV